MAEEGNDHVAHGRTVGVVALGLGLGLGLLGVATPAQAQTTTAKWKSAVSGTFDTPALWDTGLVPDDGDPAQGGHVAVVVDATGDAAYTVLVPFDSARTIDSLTINSPTATVDFRSNLFHAGAITVQDGTLSVSGFATIADAVVSSTASGNVFATGYATLVNLTAGSDVAMSGQFSVQNGLNLNGHTVTFGPTGFQAGLVFSGDQTLQGPGTLRLSNEGMAADGTLTIPQGTNVDLGNGDGGMGASVAGQIINRGQITGAGNGNNGLALSRITNEGLISVSGHVNLGDLGPNTGTIALNNAFTTLSGTVTPDLLFSLQRTGGSLTITGQLLGTGRTLDLAPVGPLTLAGTIQGGTLHSANPVTLTLGSVSGPGSARLRDVTVDAPLNLVAPDRQFVDLHDVTLNSTLTIGGTEPQLTFGFDGEPSTLSGNGQLLFAQGTNSLVLVNRDSTIGAGVTVGTGTGDGTVDVTRGGVNLGTLRATAGHTLGIRPGTDGLGGTIRVDAGGIVALSGTWPVPSLIATAIRDPGGVIAYEGEVDNTGKTIDFNSGPLAPVDLGGADITGGTIASTGRTLNAVLTPRRFAPSQFVLPTLSGVTLAANLALQQDDVALRITNGLTLLGNASVSMRGAGTYFLFDGSQTLGGSGEFVFDHPLDFTASSSLGGNVSTQTLTLGPDVRVRTGTGSGTVGGVGPLVNFGTISAQTPGQVLTIGGALTNHGTLRAVNGGTLVLNAAWTSDGTVNVDAGTLRLGGASSPTSLAATTFANDAKLVITGTYNNAGGTLVVRDASRVVTLGGGTISGGTVSSPTGDPLVLETVPNVLTTPTLSGVILNAPVNCPQGKAIVLAGSTNNSDVTADKATVTLSGNWANNGSISVTNGGLLNVRGTPPASLGAMHVSGSTLLLAVPATHATLDAIDVTNSTISLAGVYDNTGQTLLVDPGTNRVVLGSGGTIKNGTVSANDPTKRLSTFGTLDGVTLAVGATQSSPYQGGASIVRNGLTFSGGASFSLAMAGRPTFMNIPGTQLPSLTFSGTQTLGGSGEFVFDATTDFTDPKGPGVVSVSTGATLTVGPGVTMRTGAGGGIIGNAGATVVNNGTILSQAASVARSIPDVQIDGTLSDNGTIRATGGGKVTFLPGSKLSNLSTTGTLTGGTYRVDANSTLDFGTGAGRIVSTNAASILLDGPNSRFDALAPLSVNAGQLALTGGRNFTTASNLSNSGTVTVGVASTLTVTGNFVQPAGGKLKVEVGAPTPGGGSGRLAVVGSAALGGTLELTKLEGYTPTVGDTFGIVTAGSRNGTFASVVGANASGPDLSFAVTYATGGATVTAALPGDVDLDRSVGPGDFNLLASHFGQGGQTWSTGDLDGDGIVGPGDFNLLATTFGESAGGTPLTVTPAELAALDAFAAGLTSVPEPTALVTIWAAALAGSCRRRRRSR